MTFRERRAIILIPLFIAYAIALAAIMMFPQSLLAKVAGVGVAVALIVVQFYWVYQDDIAPYKRRENNGNRHT
jgi:4-hydroxybenzoate polyprenyltransferase